MEPIAAPIIDDVAAADPPRDARGTCVRRALRAALRSRVGLPAAARRRAKSPATPPPRPSSPPGAASTRPATVACPGSTGPQRSASGTPSGRSAGRSAPRAGLPRCRRIRRPRTRRPSTPSGRPSPRHWPGSRRGRAGAAATRRLGAARPADRRRGRRLHPRRGSGAPALRPAPPPPLPRSHDQLDRHRGDAMTRPSFPLQRLVPDLLREAVDAVNPAARRAARAGARPTGPGRPGADPRHAPGRGVDRDTRDTHRRPAGAPPRAAPGARRGGDGRGHGRRARLRHRRPRPGPAAGDGPGRHAAAAPLTARSRPTPPASWTISPPASSGCPTPPATVATRPRDPRLEPLDRGRPQPTGHLRRRPEHDEGLDRRRRFRPHSAPLGRAGLSPAVRGRDPSGRPGRADVAAAVVVGGQPRRSRGNWRE